MEKIGFPRVFLIHKHIGGVMDYGMIGKIEKSKRYAEEPERFSFDDFTIKFDGDNNDHTVTCDHGTLYCDCEFFSVRKVCSHTMALERLLHQMLPSPAMV